LVTERSRLVEAATVGEIHCKADELIKFDTDTTIFPKQQYSEFEKIKPDPRTKTSVPPLVGPNHGSKDNT
jgi:hypothetical protein